MCEQLYNRRCVFLHFFYTRACLFYWNHSIQSRGIHVFAYSNSSFREVKSGQYRFIHIRMRYDCLYLILMEACEFIRSIHIGSCNPPSIQFNFMVNQKKIIAMKRIHLFSKSKWTYIHFWIFNLNKSKYTEKKLEN